MSQRDSERDPLFSALAETARQREKKAADHRQSGDLAPPSAAARRTIVQEISRRQAEEKNLLAKKPPTGESASPELAGKTENAGNPTDDDVIDGTPADDTPPPIPFPERFRSKPTWIGAAKIAATLAVVATGLWLQMGPEPPLDGNPNDTPLPNFASQLLGTTQSERGPSSSNESSGFDRSGSIETLDGRFELGNRFELLLRPEVRIEQPLTASLLRWQDGTWNPWPGDVEVLDGGTVRFAGTVGTELALDPGRHRLAVVLSPSSTTTAVPGSPASRSWILELTIEGMGP